MPRRDALPSKSNRGTVKYGVGSCFIGANRTPSTTRQHDETSRKWDGNGDGGMKAERRSVAGPRWRLSLATGNTNLSLRWGGKCPRGGS